MAEVYFIILKINDVNVSLLPHDDAVQMFLNASDPILLEVCRRRDVSLNQNYSNDGNNTSSRQASELESQGHKVNFVDNQLVLSCNMTESTHTPTSHCTAAPVCGVSAAQSDSSQRNPPASVANANTTKKPKLTLYFPPPPPITQQTIETDARSIVASRAEISNLISNTNSQLLNSVKANSASLIPSPRSAVLDEIQSSPSPKHKSTAVQTDDSDLVHSLFHATNAESSDAIVEREHNLFEASLAPEIDIEEITLRKSDSNEHLGLTVCYSATGNNMGCSNTSVQNGASMPSEDNENCAEIYISSIQRDSIAGRDGRLRQGDQILQVNGKDVTNKKDTETLIAENNNAVTLLVSRYLYADEDDFNGTCVPGLDDEEDEDDDDDDDDEDEYYDNNNLAYENGFITASNCTTEAESLLHRELIGTESSAQATSTISITPNASQLKSLDELDRSKEIAAIPVSTTKSFPTSNKKIKSNSRSHLLMKYDPLQHQSIKAHLQQVNQELALLNCRVQNMMVKPINYDTDHIYETIPEDSESEPFYCSPYENAAVHSGSFAKHAGCTSNDAVHLQQQKQRVAAWLGMQHTQRQQIANISNRNNSMLHCPQVLSTWNSSTVGSILASSIRSKNGTVRSTANASTIESSSSGTGHIFPNEQDNSSSAYNTGSNNSGTALTLIINSPHLRNIEQNDSEPVLAQAVHSPKNKLTSPKHQNTNTASLMKMSLPDETSVGGVHCDYHNVSKLPAESAEVVNGIQQQLSTCTMYTNLANLQQTMLLQQQLFRKALLKQQEQKHFNFNVHEKPQPQPQPQPPPHQPQSQSCAQFTTPNMSEYHFVSSQEVSAKEMRAAAVAASASKNEEPMVWKVKKRPDGTRYIVRRPARNRIFPERTLGINPVRENQDLYTTEDDTISEIKTGRYWTREERKKHIERARQRRQHHQQQLARTTAMRICDRAVIDSSIKCHTQSSKEKAVKPITPITTNQPQQISQKLHIQNPSKLQHHKLQFSSMTASPTETSKNKQTMPTVVASGAAMNPHVTATADASPESIEPRVDSTTLNTLQKSANGMTAVAGSNAATIMPQPQTATTNEHKLVGLLSVTTV